MLFNDIFYSELMFTTYPKPPAFLLMNRFDEFYLNAHEEKIFRAQLCAVNKISFLFSFHLNIKMESGVSFIVILIPVFNNFAYCIFVHLSHEFIWLKSRA